MENVMYGILNGFGIEQLLVAFAAGIVAALVKRKIKLDVKRELIVRLVVALGLAAILCAALKQNYGWLISQKKRACRRKLFCKPSRLF